MTASIGSKRSMATLKAHAKRVSDTAQHDDTLIGQKIRIENRGE